MIDLTDAREYLQIDPDDDSPNSALQGYIDGITGAIEEYLHKVIAPREVTEDVELCGEQSFWLSHKPVISLTSIVSLDGSVIYDTANFLARPSGRVWILNGPRLYGVNTVTTQAGYETLPDNYIQGALVTLQYLWEARRNAGQTTSEGGGVVGLEEYHEIRYAASDFIRRSRVWFGVPTSLAR